LGDLKGRPPLLEFCFRHVAPVHGVLANDQELATRLAEAIVDRWVAVEV
jgi:hypothetical protein